MATKTKKDTGFDLNELLAGLVPSTIESVESRIGNTVSETIVKAINDKAKEHVEAWFEREIAPALLESLESKRVDILAASVKASEDMTRLIGEALCEAYRIKQEGEYERHRSLAKLLGLS